jgi:hypothetical protein
VADVFGLVSIQQEDYLGVSTSFDLPIKTADSNTIATLATQLQAFQAVYDPMTGAVIRKVTLKLNMPADSGNKTDPVAGCENEKTGLFNYSQTGSVYKYGIDVPGIDEALIVDGKINLTDAIVEAFDAWLKIAHSNVQAVSKYGLVLVALLDALLSFRKHRRAENRRSYEIG